MKRLLIPALLFAVPAFAQQGPRAPDPNLADPDGTYVVCLEIATLRPEQGIEMAGKWVGLGGGENARHCQAVALIGLEEYAEAGSRLEELAEKSIQDNGVRAAMLSHAGQAWLLGGEPERANAALTTALQIVPKGGRLHADILVDRAAALAEAQNYWEAIDDLNEALEMNPANSDALAFRASAYRYVDAPDLALDDAERAVEAGPQNANAYLERGNLYRLKGRNDDARQDWIKVLEISADGDAADAARANIERMDVNPDAPFKSNPPN